MAVDWTPKAMLQMQMSYRGSAKDIGDAGDMGTTRWMLWRRATVRRCAFKRAVFDIFCCSKKLNYPITYLQLISDIVIFVQKKDVKIQPTNQPTSAAQLLKCGKAIHWNKSTMKNGNYENHVFCAAIVN